VLFIRYHGFSAIKDMQSPALVRQELKIKRFLERSMKRGLLVLTIVKLLPGILRVCNIQIMENLYDPGRQWLLGKGIP